MSKSLADAKLNPAQRDAVMHVHGPLLVLAGAGSGKTRVITYRMANLLAQGIPARQIGALTFTNKAAGEMHERVSNLLADLGHGASAARELTVSTFHSFGLDFLRKEESAIGGKFAIYDQGDVQAVVREALKHVVTGKTYDVGAIVARISKLKNAFIDPEQFEPKDDDYDVITHMVYPRYVAAMRNFRAFDFDDLVCEVVRVLRTRPDVRSRWQERMGFWMVDEYQDTNGAQLELLRHLVGPRKNVCVVGDDDQSIYGWRGAEARNILDFEEHFTGAKIVKLEQNYRSRAPILVFANAVLEKRAERKYPKVLFTEQPAGDAPRFLVSPSAEAEADWVAAEIRRLITDEGRRPKDFAILYRSNLLAEPLEESLREQRVNYKVFGGQSVYEKKEVKDVLAYLRLVVSPHDDLSLRRVVNFPPRGLGETSLETIATHAVGRGWTLHDALDRLQAIDGIPTAARTGAEKFLSILADARRALAGGTKPSVLARSVVTAAGIREYITTTSKGTEFDRRWGNIEWLFTVLERKERAGTLGSGAGAFAQVLQQLSLSFNDDDDQGGDYVTLSTLHGSKGLEWEVVFLIGCEEGYLPHQRTLEVRATEAISTDVEEERRLFYVGVTRARERLYLGRCDKRMIRGKQLARVASRFLADLPTEGTEEILVPEKTGMSLMGVQTNLSNLLAALKGFD
jgi:ATP-dependent DNA helicase Rep